MLEEIKENKNKRQKLSITAIKAVTHNAPLQEKKEKRKEEQVVITKKIKLKDLEKFSKSVRFPKLWKDEIEDNIDYPMDLSAFIVEAIKEKMIKENMKIFLD